MFHPLSKYYKIPIQFVTPAPLHFVMMYKKERGWIDFGSSQHFLRALEVFDHIVYFIYIAKIRSSFCFFVWMRWTDRQERDINILCYIGIWFAGALAAVRLVVVGLFIDCVAVAMMMIIPHSTFSISGSFHMGRQGSE